MQVIQVFLDSLSFRRKLLDEKAAPLPIKIKAKQITPGTAMHHPIDINHGQHHHLIAPHQGPAHLRAPNQLFHQSLTNKTAHSLTGMLPGHNQNGLFLKRLSHPYPHHWNYIISEGMADFLYLEADTGVVQLF